MKKKKKQEKNEKVFFKLFPQVSFTRTNLYEDISKSSGNFTREMTERIEKELTENIKFLKNYNIYIYIYILKFRVTRRNMRRKRAKSVQSIVSIA